MFLYLTFFWEQNCILTENVFIIIIAVICLIIHLCFELAPLCVDGSIKKGKTSSFILGKSFCAQGCSSHIVRSTA